jgi:predicted transcriptional regulator
MQHIELRSVEKPRDKELDEDIQWVCDSFGLVTGRDTNQTSAKIVSCLIDNFAEDVGIATELVARDLMMSSALVNHHVRNLMDSGLVYRERKLIFLRGGSLRAAVEEMRKDANRMFDEISVVADEIDSAVGLRMRQ